MRRLMLLALLLLAAAAGGADASPPGPIVRAELSKSVAHVGESVMLELTILVPGWFTGPVTLPPSLDLAGLQAQLAEAAGANVVETIGGVAYSGIRRRYVLVPLRAGGLQVPPLPIQVAFADGDRRVRAGVQSRPLTLQARIPAELAHLGYLIASPRYRLQQHLDRPLSNLRAGDALVRTIVQRGEAMSATQLPVLRARPVEGIATYADDPVVETLPGEPGTPDAASQRQRITYLLQRPGSYQLPALQVHWLNTRSGKVETETLASLRIDVGHAPDARPVSPGAGTSGTRLSARPGAAGTLMHWAWLAGMASALGSLVLRRQRLLRERAIAATRQGPRRPAGTAGGWQARGARPRSPADPGVRPQRRQARPGTGSGPSARTTSASSDRGTPGRLK